MVHDCGFTHIDPPFRAQRAQGFLFKKTYSKYTIKSSIRKDRTYDCNLVSNLIILTYKNWLAVLIIFPCGFAYIGVHVQPGRRKFFPYPLHLKKGRGEARQKGGKNYRALIYEKNFLVSKSRKELYNDIIGMTYDKSMAKI